MRGGLKASSMRSIDFLHFSIHLAAIEAR